MPAPCQWIRGVLAAYLAGELKPTTGEAVRRHLEHCEACRAHARLLEQTWRLLDVAERPPMRSGFTARMMARIVEEKDLQAMEARLRPHRVRRQVAASVCGLAAGLVLGLALYGWTGMLHEPTSPAERQVSQHLTFLEDADLLDEIAVIEAVDRLVGEDVAENGA